MNPLFSGGWPRPGQWVLLDVGGQKRLAICNPPGSGKHDEDLRKFLLEHPDVVRVDLVEMEGPRAGLKTIAHELVNVMDLAPLLDRSRIPAPRLKTMDPKWEPVP
ncbi:MAG TPA: hypothetical protein VJU16_06715 [Planctomycetota bacterium]|nr:hypothetical protein [Planctomycetota bacterium]